MNITNLFKLVDIDLDLKCTLEGGFWPLQDEGNEFTAVEWPLKALSCVRLRTPRLESEEDIGLRYNDEIVEMAGNYYINYNKVSRHQTLFNNVQANYITSHSI